MILLGNLKKINDENFLVGFRYYNALNDGCKIEDIIGNNELYVLANELPEEMYYENKSSELHVNPKTKEVWYEYMEISKTDEQITKETIEKLQKDNAQLLKENVKKDVIIESLSKDVADIYKMVGGNK